jgi:hypothetical protein
MKTFLRTTLFWLVAGIAFLIVSGFGYGSLRLTPVFDQLYLVKRLPPSVVQHLTETSSTELPTEQIVNNPAIQIETD